MNHLPQLRLILHRPGQGDIHVCELVADGHLTDRVQMIAAGTALALELRRVVLMQLAEGQRATSD
jgi:hypothetical protein